MTRRIRLCLGVLTLIVVGCGASAEDDAPATAGAVKADEAISPSVAFAETVKLAPDATTNPEAAKLFSLVQYTPLTPCDMMLWADTEDDNLETDPTNFAAWAGGAAVKAPKKKMAFVDAQLLAGRYLAFSDPDAEKASKVKKDWIQSLIDRGLDGTGLKSLAATSTPAKAMSSAAVNECNTYVESITHRTWGCLQHMVADYVAIKNGRDTVTDSKELQKLPFYSYVRATPGPDTDKSRRYVLPTVSYRTMKALSGYWGKVGKAKELQDLAADAVKYFEENEFDDPRAKAAKPGKENWIGYWDNSGGDAKAYCSFEDAARELKK